MIRSSGEQSPRWWLWVALMVGLWAPRALAGRVVVFPFTGDRHGRVREELLRAVHRMRDVELISFSTYRAAAARRGLRGVRAITPSGVAKVAPAVGASVEVSGAVGRTFFVEILGPDGLELWSKELPLHSGRLSARNAHRLARAVEVAAKQVAATEGSAPTQSSQAQAERRHAPPGSRVQTSTPVQPERRHEVPESKAEAARGPRDQPSHTSEHGDTDALTLRLRPSGYAQGERGTAPARGTEPAPGTDLTRRTEPSHSLAPKVPATLSRPPIVTLHLLGATTLRSYCARPGVASCADYAGLGSPPPGLTIDYGEGGGGSAVPYVGIDAEAEVFPFAASAPFLRGWGISASYHRGFVLTSVQVSDGAGKTPSTEVNSIDTGFDLEATWRWFFRHGRAWGWLGVRAGFRERRFETDPSVQELLPGTGRAGPVVGVDFEYPMLRWLALDGSFELLPAVTPLTSQTVYFGSQGGGSGFGFRAGLEGDFWGPLGYFAQFRWTRVRETFSGPGKLWSAGGADQEIFMGAVWGIAIHL